MTTKPKRVTTIEELKRSARGGTDYFIALNFGLRSSKHIIWDEDAQRFYVFNCIDDTEQELTAEQLMDDGYTNIGKAMKLGALYLD